MLDDPALIALDDESMSLIDAIDLLPIAFWEEYCKNQDAVSIGDHTYSGLDFRESYAIRMYVDHADWVEFNKIIADLDHVHTPAFRKFIIDRPKRPRKKGKPRYSPIFIYYLASDLKPFLGSNEKIFDELSKHYPLSYDVVERYYKQGKAAAVVDNRNKKQAIKSAYLEFLQKI